MNKMQQHQNIMIIITLNELMHHRHSVPKRHTHSIHAQNAYIHENGQEYREYKHKQYNNHNLFLIT